MYTSHSWMASSAKFGLGYHGFHTQTAESGDRNPHSILQDAFLTMRIACLDQQYQYVIYIYISIAVVARNLRQK